MRINRLFRTNPVLHAVLIAIILINIFPVFWMISSAFKVPTELFTSKIQLFPHAPTLENFRTSIVDYSFFTWLLNSIGTTLGISVGQMIVAILAAFALCFFKTKYNEFIFYFLLSTIVIPFQVTMIPNYILISKAGLLNTWMAVILPNIASASTFFFLRQHFRGVPQVFYEVAIVEGANSFWILKNVVLPISRSSILAMFILCVIDGWNLYFWPLLVLSTPQSRTLTIGLQQFLDHEMGNRWGPFMATATLASLPVIILFFFIQKRIIEAFVSSGIKG